MILSRTFLALFLCAPACANHWTVKGVLTPQRATVYDPGDNVAEWVFTKGVQGKTLLTPAHPGYASLRIVWEPQ